MSIGGVRVGARRGLLGAERSDALTVARRLAASGRPWFWLDGEGAAAGEPRASYLGIASEVREARRGSEAEFLRGLRRGCGEGAAAPGFSGGWILALGYEFGVGLLGVDPHPDDASPGFALRADAVIVVDHEAGTCEIVGDPLAAAPLRQLLEAPDGAPRPPANASRTAPTPRPEGLGRGWRNADYIGAVEQCRSAIRRGDAYVLCLTDTVESESAKSPLELYEGLRGGAVRGGVVALADRALVSASPERFLSVRALPGDGGLAVSTHPIKGTRPRGDTPERDAELAEELAKDPKERAENLMIVDLMRNDLARVCVPGSVRVDRFLAVETHPRVHQLVSSVSGVLAGGSDSFDAIASCFPGGSMTGAPKRRAVELLGELEPGPRGLYSGCFGWVSDGGAAELAMTIRGVELRRGEPGGGEPGGEPWTGARWRALVGAGGGITIDSVAADELAERDLKAAAMLANL